MSALAACKVSCEPKALDLFFLEDDLQSSAQPSAQHESTSPARFKLTEHDSYRQRLGSVTGMAERPVPSTPMDLLDLMDELL
jgi:hypothetical protein